MKYPRHGSCSRCGKCCNVNNFPPGTTTIGLVREDGSCVHLNRANNDCLRHVTVRGKPTVCQLFPMGPSDIVSIPECTYSFVSDENEPAKVVEQANLVLLEAEG